MKISFALTLDTLSQHGISQSLVIEPSRTSQTALLYVFFDATLSTGLDNVNNLPNTDFTWNFNVTDTDPNRNWEVTKGMIPCHVFEEPAIPTVTCNLTARNGHPDTQDVTITVSGFTGTTYYVSNTENDALIVYRQLRHGKPPAMPSVNLGRTRVFCSTVEILSQFFES